MCEVKAKKNGDKLVTVFSIDVLVTSTSEAK